MGAARTLTIIRRRAGEGRPSGPPFYDLLGLPFSGYRTVPPTLLGTAVDGYDRQAIEARGRNGRSTAIAVGDELGL